MLISSSHHIERIHLDALLPQLTAQARAYTLEIVECTGSTNTDLLERWRTCPDLNQAVIRLAYEQTAGRGRQKRRWHAAHGDALLFSIACRLPRPLSELAGLSLALGAALLEGLRAWAPDPLKRLTLKWPNDLLLDHKKLAGILIETAQHTPHSTDVIIGIGLNLNPPLIPAEASKHADPTTQPPLDCAALTDFLPIKTTTALFAALLNSLTSAIEDFGQQGFAPFLPLWLNNHAYTGYEACLLEQGQKTYTGQILGVDTQGRLLLKTEVGIQAIMSGDLSLRAMPKKEG